MAFKLTKAKEYAILYLRDTLNYSPEDIANELNISVSTVNDFLSDKPQQTPKNTETAKNKTTKAHDMMIRHTSSKSNNNISVMTKEANEYQEEMIKNMGKQNKKENPAIFKMR